MVLQRVRDLRVYLQTAKFREPPPLQTALREIIQVGSLFIQVAVCSGNCVTHVLTLFRKVVYLGKCLIPVLRTGLESAGVSSMPLPLRH